MKDHDIPPQECLDCGEPLDAAMNITGQRAPEEGDITACANCGHIMAFDDHQRYRELTDDEIDDLAGSPAMLKAQKMVAIIKEIKAKKALRTFSS